MRRPSMDDVRRMPVVGEAVVELFEFVGLDLDELPDIIPDDTGNEAFQRVLMEHLKAKGWSEEDLRRPLGES